MDCYKQVYRTARKAHECDFCGKQIEKGEKYSYESWKDGDFYHSSLCLICRNIIEKFIIEERPDDYTFDNVCEWLNDTYCHSCKDCDCCECFDLGVQNCGIIRGDFEE